MAIKHGSKVDKSFSASSMTDLMFLLLLFLLIATTLINPNALKLMLPKSSNQLKDKAMTTVSVQDAGHGAVQHGLVQCAAAHGVDGSVDRHGVLPCVQNAVNAANGVGMSLTHAASPKGIAFAARQRRLTVQPHEREHARVPARGDKRDVTAFLCRLVHGGKMLRDVAMGVKAVEHVEVLCQLRCHFRQIGRAAAADNEQIDIVFVLQNVLRGKHPGARQRFDRLGVAAGEHAEKRQIAVLRDGKLHALAEIAVAVNCQFHENRLL